MRGSFRLAIQTSKWSRFAQVDVDVLPAANDDVAVVDDSIREDMRRAALLGGRQVLHLLPGTNQITIMRITVSPVDTSVADVAEATARAVWNAYGMPQHDVSLHDQWLVEHQLAELRGRTLLAVTEARHWFAGRRDDDATSLIHPWFHLENAAPIQLHVHGEDLMLSTAEPYTPYDMDEYGQIRVGPAQPPDLLAEVVGQRLRATTPLRTQWASEGRVGAILMEFSSTRILIGASGDDWVLVDNPSPDYLASRWDRCS
ncbi:hypothetical protein AB0M47_32485 [Hamadaea sp. NPDC051192]|uniref:hypothetical protein n=1 Tax=Hamadaea sp. NPDC051192 TaxID=3154940 RepID=UPI0034320B14